MRPWFSDVWFDIVGTSQDLAGRDARDRSAAFPFELVYWLANRFSVKHDTVLDPFLGTGTTTLAAMASERHSIGLEIEPAVRDIVHDRFAAAVPAMNAMLRDRVGRHVRFVAERAAAGKPPAHHNTPHDVPCVSAQGRSFHARRVDTAPVATASEPSFLHGCPRIPLPLPLEDHRDAPNRRLGDQIPAAVA